jgi:hypothetical protein
VPPARSPLARELTPRRRCAPRRRRPAAATNPRTAPAAATSPYHRLRQVPSGTRTAQCRRRCAPSPTPPKHVPRDPAPGTSRAAATAAAPVAALASPIPRRPRECRCRRRSWCVPRVSPPPARPPPPPLAPLLQLLQPDDRVGIGHRHLPRHQVRALLAIVCRDLAPFLISSSPPPGTEACQIVE